MSIRLSATRCCTLLCLFCLCFTPRALGQLLIDPPAASPTVEAEPTKVASKPFAPAAAIAGDPRTLPQRRAAFYQRQLTDTYRTHSQRDPAWDAAAIQLLDDFSQYQAYVDYSDHPVPQGIATLEALQQTLASLLETPCDDPIIRFVFQLLDPKRVPPHWRPIDLESQQALRNLARNLGKPNAFEPMLLSLEHLILKKHQIWWGYEHQWYHDRRINAATNHYALLFDQSITLHPDDMIEFSRLFNGYARDFHANLLAPLQEATENVTPDKQWFAHMLRGNIFFKAAWDSIGTHWLDDLDDDDEQRKEFKHLLSQAQEHFEAAWAMHPNRSQSAEELIIIANCHNENGNDSQEKKWFKRATAADPLSHFAYPNMRWAKQALAPSSHRDKALMAFMARKALASNRYDTSVPDQFADVAIRNFLYHFNETPPYHDELSETAWKMMHHYLKRRAAHPSPDRSTDWCWSRGFELAYHADRTDDMWDYFSRLDEDPDRLHKPHVYGLDRRWDFGRISLQREPQGLEACEQAHRLVIEDNPQEAIQTLTDALPKLQHPLSKIHLRDRIRIATWQMRFKQNLWVDLLEHGLEGWRPTRGLFEEIPGQEGVRGTFLGPRGGLRMFCGFSPGQRYEATLTMTLPKNFHQKHLWGGAGFVLDTVAGRGSGYSTLCFISRATNSGIFLKDRGKRSTSHHYFKPHIPDVDIVMHLKRWDQSIQVSVNGRTLIERHDLEIDEPSTHPLALGAYLPGDAKIFEFKALKIRQLIQSPFEQPEQEEGPGMI
ncbi:MAG: hypothetical protein V3V20_03995 [Algisphaera sp.]